MERQTRAFDTWDDETAQDPRLVLMPDRFDSPETRFYGAYAFKYQTMYLGYLETVYFDEQRIDTQLISSRDGISWERVADRQVFLANGEHGDFDGYWIVPTFNPPR